MHIENKNSKTKKIIFAVKNAQNEQIIFPAIKDSKKRGLHLYFSRESSPILHGNWNIDLGLIKLLKTIRI